MQKLTGTMIQKMFDREAVFICHRDVVPDWRIAKLFGKAALEFAQKMAPEHFNGYGIGDYTEFYADLQGFQLAATYCNIRITQKERQAAKD